MHPQTKHMHVPTRTRSEPPEEAEVLIVLQSTGGARTNRTKVDGSFFKVTPDNFLSLSVSRVSTVGAAVAKTTGSFLFPSVIITTATQLINMNRSAFNLSTDTKLDRDDELHREPMKTLTVPFLCIDDVLQD